MSAKAAAVKLPDASLNVTLNGVRVLDPRLADKLRIPLGETVAWAVAFPRAWQR